MFLGLTGEDGPSIFIAKRNKCQSSTDHLIFLLTCLQKHFLRKAITIDFQIKCTHINISEILESRNYSELCKCIPDDLWQRRTGIVQVKTPPT